MGTPARFDLNPSTFAYFAEKMEYQTRPLGNSLLHCLEHDLIVRILTCLLFYLPPRLHPLATPTVQPSTNSASILI